MCYTISPVYGSSCTFRHTLDESLLADFALLNCTSIVGGLAIDNLPRHLDEDALQAAFVNIHTIFGLLTVSDNRYLTSISFLKNLRRVDFLIVHNNPVLIDARLPSLDHSSLDEVREVSNNPRMHPSHRHPLSSANSDLAECFNCPHLTATFTLQVKPSNAIFSSTDLVDLLSNEVLGLNETEEVQR